MSKTAWTPGPWETNWFSCRADASDVAYARSKGRTKLKVGDLLWRMPRSIGPISIDRNHWAGGHLDVSEADARLIAEAPAMAEALELTAAAIDALHPSAAGDMSDGDYARLWNATREQLNAILARIKGEAGR